MLPTHQQDSLDPYLSFTLAAAETEHIRFGPLVTPITFRHPVNLGRMAAQIDLLSGGRFVMGVGAGWNVGEHAAYGLDFPSTRERFDRLSEGIEVMRALWGEGPASYEGTHYRLQNADCLPKPDGGASAGPGRGERGEAHAAVGGGVRGRVEYPRDAARCLPRQVRGAGASLRGGGARPGELSSAR